MYEYFYKNYETGVPEKIIAPSKSEARKKAKAMGLSGTEVTADWKGLGRRSPGSLKDTMTTTAEETKTRSLPVGEMSQTALLQAALGGITQGAYKKGVKTATRGVESKLGEMGLGAEKVRPASSAGIIDFVEQRVREPVERAFETATFLTTSIAAQREREKDRARDNLNLLLAEPGALSALSGSERRTLADEAGVELSTLNAVRKAQQANSAADQLSKDMGRVDNLSAFFNARRGEDGLISADDYVSGQRKWIGLEGNITDFRAAFQPESLMGEWELPKLPESMRPKGVVEEEEWTDARIKAVIRTGQREFKTKQEIRDAFLLNPQISEEGKNRAYEILNEMMPEEPEQKEEKGKDLWPFW